MGNVKFTDYIPQTLTGVNSPSPSLAAEAVTGLPIATGARPGQSFYLNENQANQLSSTSNPFQVCHAGWYRVVKVDAAATAGNIAFGYVGAMLAISTGTLAVPSSGTVPVGEDIVTSYDKALNGGIAPCVFLGAVTPGYYTIVQDYGDAMLTLAVSQTTAIGTMLVSGTGGLISAAGAISDAVYLTFVGVAEQVIVSPAAALTLTAAAAASGGSTAYTGTITGGGSNAFAGNVFVVAGFANAGNNGTFICTASTTTVLTLTNANGVAETHAGTATAQNWVRARLGFPFGVR